MKKMTDIMKWIKNRRRGWHDRITRADNRVIRQREIIHQQEKEAQEDRNINVSKVGASYQQNDRVGSSMIKNKLNKKQ